MKKTSKVYLFDLKEMNLDKFDPKEVNLDKFVEFEFEKVFGKTNGKVMAIPISKNEGILILHYKIGQK